MMITFGFCNRKCLKSNANMISQALLIKGKTMNVGWSTIASIFELHKVHAYQHLSVASKG
jgi:hypothetical protein